MLSVTLVVIGAGGAHLDWARYDAVAFDDLDALKRRLLAMFAPFGAVAVEVV